MGGKYENIGKVTQISIGILLLYMAFNSASNIQTTILEEYGFGDLGYYILAICYFFIGIGSLMSTGLINKFGTKATLVQGGIGITIWILSTLLAVYSVELEAAGVPYGVLVAGLILGSVIDGLTVGILWSSANQYIADCSSDENKGFYFSYFWSFYMTSQIAGNLTAAFVIGRLHQSTYYEIMACISVVATISFLFIRKPILFMHKLPDIHDHVPANLRRSFSVVHFEGQPRRQSHGEQTTDVSTGLVAVEEAPQGFKEDIKSVLRLLVSKRMRPILPQVAWTGISIAVYTGLLVPIITSTVPEKTSQERFEVSMLAMVALGFGEIFGALGIGYIVDRIGAWKTSFFNILFIILQTIAVLVFIIMDEYNWVAFLMTFLWGVQDSSISIHLDAILAGQFETNKEPFACDVLLEAVAAFSFEIISSFMDTKQERIIYIIVIGVIGVLSASCSLLFKFKNEKEKYLMFDNNDNKKVDVNVISNPNNYLINEEDEDDIRGEEDQSLKERQL